MFCKVVIINELSSVTFVTCFFETRRLKIDFLGDFDVAEKNLYPKFQNKTRFLAANCRKSGYKGNTLIIKQLSF